MKQQPALRLALCACLAGIAAAPQPSQAIDLNPLHLFRSDEKKVPSAEEKATQEAAASEMLRDARTAASTGSTGRAQGIYKDIDRRFPYTDSAGDAAYENAVIERQNGRGTDAFDAFQNFITGHPKNRHFAEALQAQFEITEEARAGKKEAGIIPIKMKVDVSRIVEQYNKIIKNAPYGKLAAPAQFAIGEVYQDDGNKTMANGAFQAVVDNYPNTKQASEAQFRVGAISSAAARKTQDASNLVNAREALETYKTTHPAGERMGEVQSGLSQITEAQAQQSLKIAQFYEKAGKPKAAAIYYNEAMKYGAPEASLKARERLAVLAAANGESIKENTGIEATDYTVPAAVNLKSRDDYAGPPAPELATANRKSKMRVDRDEFKPIPVQEPDLPTRAGAPPAPGMLVPPADGEKDKPLLLPIPPAPGMKAPNAPETPSASELPTPPPPAPAAEEKKN
jgi:outer membrane protein assembly factor BamD (BamD/ComL family)